MVMSMFVLAFIMICMFIVAITMMICMSMFALLAKLLNSHSQIEWQHR